MTRYEIHSAFKSVKWDALYLSPGQLILWELNRVFLLNRKFLICEAFWETLSTMSFSIISFHKPTLRHLWVIRSICLRVVVKMYSRWQDETLPSTSGWGAMSRVRHFSTLWKPINIAFSDCNDYVRFIDFLTRKSAVWDSEHVHIVSLRCIEMHCG